MQTIVDLIAQKIIYDEIKAKIELIFLLKSFFMKICT